MKKTYLIFGVIIVGLYVALTAMDKSDYKVEKRLWSLSKEYAEIANDPDSMPDQKVEDVVQKYRAVATEFSGTNVTRIYFQMASLYVLNKQFDQARDVYKEITEQFSDREEVVAEAYRQIALTYAREEKPDEALRVFRKTIKDFPLTEVGMESSFFIGSYLISLEREAEGQAALNEAVVRYQDLIKEYPESKIAFNAHRLLASTYFAQQRWRSGVAQLGEILNTYADSEFLIPERVRLVVSTINSTSAVRLRDYNVAIGIYEDFIANHPDHRFNKFLQNMIDNLQVLKEKNVRFNRQN